MMRKILIILMYGFIILGLTGCGSNSKVDKQDRSDNTNSESEKVVTCTKSGKTQTVYLKGKKLIKIVNSMDDASCDGIKRIYGPLNDMKGTSVTITCNPDDDYDVHHEETYIIDEIENINALDGERFPNQLGGAYFDEETHEFNLKFWLEGKNTQNFTCEEK